MIRLVKLEVLKLITTPGFYVTMATSFVLSLVSAVTNLLLTVPSGGAPFGSRAHVDHVLTQPAAVAR